MPSETSFNVDREQLQVRLSRIFAASPERVWQAMTDPTQIPQWWGPAKYKTVVDKHELKAGGEWRFIQTDETGKEEAFHGKFLELDPPHKAVQTFVYEGIPDADNHALTDTMTLTDLGNGKTRLDIVTRYSTIDDLDGMVASGMEAGSTESYDRLASLVEG